MTISFKKASSRQSTVAKPRLIRQSAFQDETQEPSSPRLNVRFLPTIPSAPDSSVQLEEESDDQPNSSEDVQPAHMPEDDTSKLSSLKLKSDPP